MERGVNENTTAEVSLTYFFTLKTYRQIALASKFGAALVVSYITEVKMVFSIYNILSTLLLAV